MLLAQFQIGQRDSSKLRQESALLRMALKCLKRIHAAYYKHTLGTKLGTASVRNVMDMNAFFGGFAAALSSDPVWVMDVVPSRKSSTLIEVSLAYTMIGKILLISQFLFLCRTLRFTSVFNFLNIFFSRR